MSSMHIHDKISPVYSLYLKYLEQILTEDKNTDIASDNPFRRSSLVLDNVQKYG
jgi:hypothetical protein